MYVNLWRTLYVAVAYGNLKITELAENLLLRPLLACRMKPGTSYLDDGQQFLIVKTGKKSIFQGAGLALSRTPIGPPPIPPFWPHCSDVSLLG